MCRTFDTRKGNTTLNMEELTNVKDLTGAAPYEIAENIIKILDERKGISIRLLHVEGQSSITDYLVLCTGSSNTQIKALAGEVEYKMSLCGLESLNIDGYNEGTWIVIDYGPVMVHVFSRDMRDFYKLEKLYGETSEVDISGILTDN